MINGKTRVVGIVADPIEHVRTPERFNAYMQELGCNAVLVPLHVRPENFAAFIASLPAMRNLAGLVVTIPYKESVLPLCTELSDAARQIGAVNVLRIDHELGALVGTNLDGEGFTRGLLAQGHAIRAQHVYIAGAGGAAKAIAHTLANHGAASIAIYNRTESRARQLVEELRAHHPHLVAEVAGSVPEHCTLAVNSTSLGLQPGDGLPFELDRLPVGAVVAEVVMNPDMTPLLLAAAKLGHPIHLGRHMVDAQIEEMARFFGLA
ncbi:shikimate dehydrogenase [Pseudomonas sp. LS44]|uniref:shikimate dehydrogenase family protein n=1 Tax=Pseudomonas sp. LS44 TaxID=1357074 RepID=UPI00215B569C|nr:shikimate dehydrogenase [Pseudomonas sp. LS44]UVE16136.1 shikimate dehydrogenase [Pseudomonas sp. LS44]